MELLREYKDYNLHKIRRHCQTGVIALSIEQKPKSSFEQLPIRSRINRQSSNIKNCERILLLGQTLHICKWPWGQPILCALKLEKFMQIIRKKRLVWWKKICKLHGAAMCVYTGEKRPRSRTAGVSNLDDL